MAATLNALGRAEYERLVCAVRDALGEAAFSTAWTEGRDLQMHEAVAFALNGLPSSPE
jgi:hypothetical protein